MLRLRKSPPIEEMREDDRKGCDMRIELNLEDEVAEMRKESIMRASELPNAVTDLTEGTPAPALIDLGLTVSVLL